MKCPSCNKFAALETQEPEVNSVEFDLENGTVTADVRLARNSECCGDEMKEASFNTEVEIPEDLKKKIDEIREEDPKAEFEAEEGSIDTLEEGGGGRYAKSYYGFTLEVEIKCQRSAENSKWETIGTVEVKDKMAASEMDELG